MTAFSILGITGSLHDENAGWLITDWLLFSTILASQPNFDATRSRFWSMTDIKTTFPDGKFTFGDAGCDRLTMSIPAPLLKTSAKRTADKFAEECVWSMMASAGRVNPGEVFVIVLAGHGELHNGEFRLCIDALPRRRGQAWIYKTQLEKAANECAGRVIIISNSCRSGALESSLWHLICAAGPDEHHELSDSLTTSESGKVRGSTFAYCLLSEVAASQGITIPVARSTPRPPDSFPNDIFPLPISQPAHSFSSSTRPVYPSFQHPVAVLVKRMLTQRQYLVFFSLRHYGFNARPWYEELPLELSQVLVDEITVLPEGPGFLTTFNAMFQESSESTQIGSSSPASTILGSSWSQESNANSKELGQAMKEVLTLGPAFVKLGRTWGRDMQDSVDCTNFISTPHLTDPSSLLDLWDTLRTRHLQSTVSQLTVVELGWCIKPVKFRPFLLLSDVLGGESAAQVLVRDGGVLERLGRRVAAAFPPTASYTDQASILWVALNWDREGRPDVTEEELKDAIDVSGPKTTGKPPKLVKGEEVFSGPKGYAPKLPTISPAHSMRDYQFVYGTTAMIKLYGQLYFQNVSLAPCQAFSYLPAQFALSYPMAHSILD
ncbi:hypothetical protein B0H12DRAFT_1232062 [Mycena haematopus]|nr:hypothetical protein B0H12DRAFT_1232062 [Mycena haematopus]